MTWHHGALGSSQLDGAKHRVPGPEVKPDDKLSLNKSEFLSLFLLLGLTVILPHQAAMRNGGSHGSDPGPGHSLKPGTVVQTSDSSTEEVQARERQFKASLAT